MRTSLRVLLVFAGLLAVGHASAREIEDTAIAPTAPTARRAPRARAHDDVDGQTQKDQATPAKYDASYPTRDTARIRRFGSI